VLLGGMLTEWAGWEWVLFVNVPIGVAAAVTISSRDCRERIESGRVDVPAPCAEQPQAQVGVAAR
jgi:hypothetical protein